MDKIRTWSVGDLVYVDHKPPAPYQLLSIHEYGIVYEVNTLPVVDDEMRLGIVTQSGRVIATDFESKSVRFIKETKLQYSNNDPTQVKLDFKNNVFSAYFANT